MSRLGPYEVHQRIANGGMAELFLASERLPDGTVKPVAIKRIRSEAARDPKLVKMLIDEGRVTKELAHPGIARTIQTVKGGDIFYLVMEYVDGRDLRSLLKKLKEEGKRLPPALAALVALRVADALDYAHRAATEEGNHLQIIHRDVNPTNLMITYSGVVRVIDFGIARANDRLTSTQAGVVKGKLRYMAPEQASGKAIDHRADIYAVGLVLYEMLAGHQPLPQMSDMEFIGVVLRGTVPPLRDMPVGVPLALDAIVEKALARDLDKRYQWCSQMAQDLEKWMSGLTRLPQDTDLASVMAKLFPGEAARLPKLLSASATPTASSSG